MAAIRHALQREVFQPCDERLLAFVHVNKALKKKKSSFLCISITKEIPIIVNVYQVKKTEKNVFKKKRCWPLTALQMVDGKVPSADFNEFDIYFDKAYKWHAANSQERQSFIIVLWKQCCHYLKEKPEFKNLPNEWTSGDLGNLHVENQVTIIEPVEVADIDEYQALTEKEEIDVEQLMEQCGFSVKNAEAFMEMLAKDLSILDGENVQSMLASEKRVSSLMEQLDIAISEIERVETQLNAYDDILCHVRNTMEKMEEKNLLIEIANRNNQKLLSELEKVIVELEMDSKHQKSLVDADLTTPQGLKDAVEAGKALQSVMNAEIHPALVQLSAVQDQKKRFDKWKSKFSQIISRHLNNLFIHLGNDPGEVQLSHSPSDLTIPKHSSIHKDLQPYTELMHWLKVMDRKAYTALVKVYTTALGKLYERDIKQFLEDAKHQVSLSSVSVGGSREDISQKSKSQTSAALLGIERDQWPETDLAERSRFHQVFERVLSQLEPICLSEQQFCVSFFQLDILSPTTKNTQTTLDGLNAETKLEEPINLPQRRVERQMNEEVRKMMAEIFGCIEPELVNFIGYYEKIDGMYCMYGLVRLSQHVMSAQDAGSFLSKSFGSVLVQVKRNYDRFMQTQLQSIYDSRGNRKSKCGILPFIANFEEFAKTAELIFKGTERRADLDKWYTKLVNAMFETIPSIAADHPKTPTEVIKMENFHHLYALLSQLKISVLDGQRKEAKQRYNDALKAYVTRYFGRPLEKLNLFFDGVQAKVGQGVKESEISYQMAYSKQELRKVIKEYPAKEVKRGLDHLYKKVEKHLSEEENLLQVVWRAMQEEFIQQYKYIEDLIQRCYPGAMIALEFSIDDILRFFSEIARSH